MAQWKVFKDKIELFPHPNADKLMLGKVGQFQVVVQKGIYEGGEDVIFIPAKSVLPEELQAPWKEYLGGPHKDRVREIRLRGELSMGAVSPSDKFFPELADVPYGEDVSERLNIHKYEPPIPQSLLGQVKKLPEGRFTQHDVEQFGIYRHEFSEDERVNISEKIHGSQVIYGRTAAGEIFVTSKGLLSRDMVLEESASNAYWTAGRNVGAFDMFDEFLPEDDVQLFGEVIPLQKGFKYGQQKLTVLFFDVRVNGESLSLGDIPDAIFEYWAPLYYTGPLKDVNLKRLADGTERVSGQGLHINEGIVIRPSPDRLASDGTRLMVKILNKKYKETGEEFN